MLELREKTNFVTECKLTKSQDLLFSFLKKIQRFKGIFLRSICMERNLVSDHRFPDLLQVLLLLLLLFLAYCYSFLSMLHFLPFWLECSILMTASITSRARTEKWNPRRCTYTYSYYVVHLARYNQKPAPISWIPLFPVSIPRRLKTWSCWTRRVTWRSL